MAAEPWYDTAFGRDYLAVYPHRDLAAARSEAAALVRGGLGGRTLDLGCGFGRHTLALRELGVEAFGLDRSAELLGRAPALEAGAGAGGRLLAGRLVRGDFRALPFAAGSLDSVCMLFSSFGYFDDAGNARVLGELRRALRAGGLAVLDLMNPARVRDELVPESLTERDGLRLEERRALVGGGRRVVKEVRLARGAAVREWREDVRLYEPPELEALVRGTGLRVERLAGDFGGADLAPTSPRLIAWLRRGP